MYLKNAMALLTLNLLSMIKGVKVIRQFGKDNRVTEFTYKDYHGGCLTEDFNKMTIADFEKLVDESHEWQRRCDEAIKRIETQRAAMIPEERAGWDEADRAVFERWQDEANANAILDGYETEKGDDPDFNPFRKVLSL